MANDSTSPKKILLVLPGAFECAGGIQMFCRALCLAAGRWAKTNGGTVTALVLNDEVAPDPRYVNGGFALYEGAGKSKSKLIRHYLTQITLSRFDWIIFGHLTLSPLALLATKLQPRAKTAVVTYGVEVWRPLTKMQRRALRSVDVVLSISDHTRAELIKHSGIAIEKIKVFPCTLDPHWDLEIPAASSECETPLLLTVARMTKEDTSKGIDSVIRGLPHVMADIGPVEYRVVGRGADVPRLRALADALGIGKHVIFTGELADAELRELYRRCSLFILPSRQEGFGIVFLEAMAYGKPVIGGLHGGTPFVVKDRETGWLVDSSDVPEIAQTIIRFLGDEKLRKSFGTAGRERLMREFTFQNFEQNFDEIFSQSR